MMEMDIFRKNVCTALQEKAGAAVFPKDVVKNNGVVLHGIEAADGKNPLAPCVYLEGWLSDYENGVAMDSIITGIENALERSRNLSGFDADGFCDYEKIRDNIHARLVNTEKNRDTLAEQPHRDFLDLSLAYCVEFPMGDGTGSIRIWNSHMEMWGVSEEDLFSQAMANMEADGSETIQSIRDVLCGMTGDGLAAPSCDVPMYVLTNSRKVNGASQIVRKEVLHRAGDILGEDYMIIPSSIHEVLLVPDSGEPDLARNIAGVVDCVNNTQVAEDEVLSYHVYRYSRSSGEVAIAA